MKILAGHPTGGPFSHHMALAHHEAGRLEVFCVPWLPGRKEAALFSALAPRRFAGFIDRRRFAPLDGATLAQGRPSEWARLAVTAALSGPAAKRMKAHFAETRNRWLMTTLAREIGRRTAAGAVHSYEDCSLGAFEAAKRAGKLCFYDLPIGYFEAWIDIDQALSRRYADWAPGRTARDAAMEARKRREIELADAVFVPSRFVESTVARFWPDKTIVLAPFGSDKSEVPASDVAPKRTGGPLRFLYAGHLSLRKGTPFLFEAWRRAALPDSELRLAGSWLLAEARRRDVPAGCTVLGHLGPSELRAEYEAADVFVFPSFFEGFGLVISEAMAARLPVVCTDATAGADLVDERSGFVLPSGDLDRLVGVLRWCAAHRDALPAMGEHARAAVPSWCRYRECVRAGVDVLEGRA